MGLLFTPHSYVSVHCEMKVGNQVAGFALLL